MDPRHDGVSVRTHGAKVSVTCGQAVGATGRSVGAAPAPSAAGTVEKVIQRLAASIGAARLERDFFNGSIFRAETGEGGGVVVRVSSPAAAEVLQRRYAAVLEESARSAGCGPVRFVVEHSAVPTALRGASGSTSAPGGGSARSATKATVVRRVSLNELVVSAQNRLALDAARRAAAGSLPAGCLVYLHGGCGLGKTHILNAVSEEAGASGSSVRCVSGEQFANEFIAAVKSEKGDKMERFRRQYRGLDVLCIDDVQSLRGKNATQNELQHTVDAVLARGGRVVLCGSCHPRRLEHLTEALVSRLMGGLVVEVGPPDVTSAARIVQALAARRGLTIETAAAEALALAVINDPRSSMRTVSVRDLEGLVTKVEAVHRLLGAGVVPGDSNVGGGGAVGMVSVNRALADRPGATRAGGAGGAGTMSGVLARIGPRQPVRLEEIVTLVCQRLSVTLTEVAGRGRHPRVVLARAASTWLARKHTRASYPEIARALGRPNHSTVITAHQRLDTLLAQAVTIDCGDGRGVRPVVDLLAECSAALGASAPPSGQTQIA